MSRKSELFDRVIPGATGGATALSKTDAHGTRRVAELSTAEDTALEVARSEQRVIAKLDPRLIEVDPLMRDRDIEAARQDSEYAELVEDIRVAGIKDPLRVRMKPGGGLMLVEGLRRLAAALDLGLADVPVIERVYKDDNDAIEDMLRENLVRHNPPPMETALLFARLLERGWTDERVTGLLRAKNWTISRLRTVARAFMPWLADAYPAYRSLPFMEMVKLAPAVDQNADRRPVLLRALAELAARDSVEPKDAVEAIRSVTLTGVWAGVSSEVGATAERDTGEKLSPRAAFDRSGAKAALLTHHEGQMVIRFTKRVPDSLIDEIWAQVETLARGIEIRD